MPKPSRRTHRTSGHAHRTGLDNNVDVLAANGFQPADPTWARRHGYTHRRGSSNGTLAARLDDNNQIRIAAYDRNGSQRYAATIRADDLATVGTVLAAAA